MRPIKRAIVLCWIMLVACFVIKLFGGNWFEVVCTNEHFSNFCNFVDENWFLHQLFSFIVYFVPSVFLILAISVIPNPTKKQLFVIFAVICLSWSLKYISLNLKMYAELLFYSCMPITLRFIEEDVNDDEIPLLKKYWYYGIVGNIIVFAFQAISLFTKSVGVHFDGETLVVTFIFLMDYYIMIALYYLYVKLKKGGKDNG